MTPVSRICPLLASQPAHPSSGGSLGLRKGCFSCDVASYRVPCLPASGLTCLHRVCTKLPRHMLPFHCHQGKNPAPRLFFFHQKRICIFIGKFSPRPPPPCCTSYIHPIIQKRESKGVMLNWNFFAAVRSYPGRVVSGANTKAKKKAKYKSREKVDE